MIQAMSTATITEFSDEIIHDKHALEMKRQIMGKMKWNALLSSVAESCKFVAGPLFGCGVGAALAVGGLTLLPITLLAVATGFLIAGVASGYASSRIWQSGQFDNFEINAESTARHLVQELKSSRILHHEEHTQNVRADGKKWAQVVGREAAGVAQQT